MGTQNRTAYSLSGILAGPRTVLRFLLSVCRWSFGRPVQIVADLCQFLLPATIGQETIVAEPHDVQEGTNAAVTGGDRDARPLGSAWSRNRWFSSSLGRLQFMGVPYCNSIIKSNKILQLISGAFSGFNVSL